MSNNNFSTISIMFEEIKQQLKRLEGKGNNKCDLTDFTVKIDQSQELLLNKLEQIEQSKPQSSQKTVNHKISIDIKSSWVFLTMIGLSVFLITSLVLNYNQKQINNHLSDNDIKYRYIKAFNSADSIRIYQLEDIFEYNRNLSAIKELRQKVNEYEQAVLEEAKRLEQARLKEAEAERLKQEAEELKKGW